MTAPTLLDFATVLDRLNAVVNERPTYVNTAPDPDAPGEYLTCFYLDSEGSPSCIVGHALHTELTEAGLTPDSRANTLGVFQLLRWHEAKGIPITTRAVRLLYDTQIKQDHGDTWRDALAYALRESAKTEHLDDTAPTPNPYLALEHPTA